MERPLEDALYDAAGVDDPADRVVPSLVDDATAAELESFDQPAPAAAGPPAGGSEDAEGAGGESDADATSRNGGDAPEPLPADDPAAAEDAPPSQTPPAPAPPELSFRERMAVWLDELRARQAELRPLIDELRQVEQAIAVLAVVVDDNETGSGCRGDAPRRSRANENRRGRTNDRTRYAPR